MGNKAHAALVASIDKWVKLTKVRRKSDFGLGPGFCPLCREFWPTCSECPVSQRTGLGGCEGTPYERADDAHTDWLHGEATGKEFRAAAREEAEFLISLLPEEYQPAFLAKLPAKEAANG